MKAIKASDHSNRRGLFTGNAGATGNGDIPSTRVEIKAKDQLGIPFENRVFNVPQVIMLFGVSRAKLYELLNDGTLASFRIGNRRLITGKAVEAAIAKLSEAAQ